MRNLVTQKTYSVPVIGISGIGKVIGVRSRHNGQLSSSTSFAVMPEFKKLISFCYLN